MKDPLAFLMVALGYAFYLVLGIFTYFKVAWVDWQAPYFHYALVELNRDVWLPFVLPAIICIVAIFLWNRKMYFGRWK